MRRRFVQASGRRSPAPWKHGEIPVIGVVGGIGSGKSTVSALLAAKGAEVLDADKVGHVLLQQKPAKEQVVKRFGAEILEEIDESTADSASSPEDRAIDRARLGAIVFGRPEGLKSLERILHPLMRRTFEKAIGRSQRRGEASAVVLDAAVLFEAGWDDLCDVIVFVDAPTATRFARVRDGRGWDRSQFDARELAQWPIEQKKSNSDAVISNNAGTTDLDHAVDRWWRQAIAPRLRKRPTGATMGPRPGRVRPAPRKPVGRSPVPPGHGARTPLPPPSSASSTDADPLTSPPGAEGHAE